MRVRMVLLLALLAASLFVASPAGATPTPPVLVVNHSTKECAEVIQGDDCHWCDPLEGWEVLGYSSQATCPAGYENLGYQGMTGRCVGYKSQFCCSDSAHHGDCEDLVIHESEQLCAFVEEIRGCTLPEGWTSAADTTPWSGRCPFGNQWVPDIRCVTTPEAAEPTATVPTAPPAPTRTATVLPAGTSTPALAATAAPTATQEPPLENRFRPGIVWALAVALGGLLVAAVWLILKGSRRR
jgi:hypothetical protein